MQRLKRWLPAIRIVASVVMLAILIQRVDVTSILPDGSHAVQWLAAAIAVWTFGILLSALRWQRVLAALGIASPLRTLVRPLPGQPVRQQLPAVHRGRRRPSGRAAVGRERRDAADVCLRRPRAADRLDRAAGPHPDRVGREPGAAASWAPPARSRSSSRSSTLVLLGGLLFAAGHPAVGGRLTSTEGWRRFTGAVHLGVEEFRRQSGLALEVLTTSFAYQLAVMLAAFFAADALGLGISWTAILAFMPAVAIVQVLPITIGGLGVREGALVLFLHPLGVSTQSAIALGLLVYGINLLVSLLGAPAFAVGASAGVRHASLRERGRAGAPAALVARGDLRPGLLRRLHARSGTAASTSTRTCRRSTTPSGHPGRGVPPLVPREVGSRTSSIRRPSGSCSSGTCSTAPPTSSSPIVAIVWLFRRDPRRYPAVAQHAGDHDRARAQSGSRSSR